MVNQWMNGFTEFSRLISETSTELAKSRLQNEELSRLLRETRAQLDTLVEEQKKKQQRDQIASSEPPPKQQQPNPSLEDWRAVQESLREVAASLRDFRAWLPTAMAPPPPLVAPPPPSQPQIMFPPIALAQLAAMQQQSIRAPVLPQAPVAPAAQPSLGDSFLMPPQQKPVAVAQPQSTALFLVFSFFWL